MTLQAGHSHAMLLEPGADAIRELPDGSVELTLPAEPSSVPLARHFVKRRWSTLDNDVLDDVALVVTELVTNAVEHGAPEICLRLRTSPFAVDIGVLDHGPGWPRRRTAVGTDDGNGRGLTIVDRLASAWGVEPVEDDTGAAKLVWASVDRA